MLTRRRADRLLLVLLSRRRLSFLADAAIGAAFFLVGMVPGLITKWVLDALASPANDSPVFWLIAALVLVKIVHVTLGIGWMVADTALRGVLLALLRHNLFDRIMALPAARALPMPVGDALSRFMEDVREVVDALCKRSGLMNLTSSLSFASVAVAVMLHIDARITVLVLLPALSVVLISYGAGRRVTRFRARSRQAAGDVSAFLNEVFSHVQLIKLSGAEERVIGRIAERNRIRRQAAVRDNVFFAILHSSSRYVLALGTGLILLVAADAMRRGDFTVGDFALFTYLLEEVGIGVAVLGDFLRRWRQAKVSAERLAPLLQGRPTTELALPQPLRLRARTPAAAPDAPPPSVAAADRLRRLDVRGLSYRYGTDGFALRNVDLTLARGSTTVITGRVGSGKSTLVQCLLGMLPPEAGTVRWNDQPVADPAAFLVPPRCAYLPQAPQLFSDTVRENILFGLPSDGRVERDAAYVAAFDEDLAAMPEGFETVVGPRGHRLSGGQRHRLAAARVIARGADLLIVDDVSSALDLQTEKVLWDRLFARALAAGWTLLIVSNRIPALTRADVVMVMDAGRVVGTGTFRRLLVDCPQLRALHPDLPAEPAAVPVTENVRADATRGDDG